MAEPRLLERLTASDLFMLLWDDYGWPNQIGGLAILDGPNLLDPNGRVRIEAVRQRLEPRLQLVPRFRQLLSRPRLGLGWPWGSTLPASTWPGFLDRLEGRQTLGRAFRSRPRPTTGARCRRARALG